ncbi:MAG: alpha amylase N-terminal ig-like domain-containing protein [Enterobacter hormaechei]
MLNAWHLPVAPFVKQNKDNLVITLWLAGENQPERVTLRAEVDNEETSLKMHKVRSQPQPGITAWRANIDLRSGQPRRRYGFKLLWNNRQLWFTPQGFSRFPPARLEQFAVDHPDNGPQWVNDQGLLPDFPTALRAAKSATPIRTRFITIMRSVTTLF